MRILLAPDKFRGSLTARQVTDAMAEGVRLVYPDADVVALPLADGGEGTAQVLTEATNGTWHTACCQTLDRLRRSATHCSNCSSPQRCKQGSPPRESTRG